MSDRPTRPGKPPGASPWKTPSSPRPHDDARRDRAPADDVDDVFSRPPRQEKGGPWKTSAPSRTREEERPTRPESAGPVAAHDAAQDRPHPADTPRRKTPAPVTPRDDARPFRPPPSRDGARPQRFTQPRDDARPARPMSSRDDARPARSSPPREDARPSRSTYSRDDTRAQRPAPPRDDASHAAADAPPRPPRPGNEQRLYGVNACLAAFAKRPQDVRKVYLVESRIPAFKAVLAWCVQQRLGYRVVEAGDLDKLTASRHHEGVCFDIVRRAPLALTELLATQAGRASSLLVWLDGVGNPHNLGALLRSAAHFGVAGVIVPASSSLDLSGAAARVAEGGAEAVALARIDATHDALDALREADYTIAATVPRDGTALYHADLPSRLVLVFGAEGEGMDEALAAAADLRLTIPGSGTVESLNIAASAAIAFGEHWRRHARG